MQVGTITTLTTSKSSCNLHYNYHVFEFTTTKRLLHEKITRAVGCKLPLNFDLQITGQTNIFKNTTGATSRGKAVVGERNKELTTSGIGGEKASLISQSASEQDKKQEG